MKLADLLGVSRGLALGLLGMTVAASAGCTGRVGSGGGGAAGRGRERNRTRSAPARAAIPGR